MREEFKDSPLFGVNAGIIKPVWITLCSHYCCFSGLYPRRTSSDGQLQEICLLTLSFPAYPNKSQLKETYLTRVSPKYRKSLYLAGRLVDPSVSTAVRNPAAPSSYLRLFGTSHVARSSSFIHIYHIVCILITYSFQLTVFCIFSISSKAIDILLFI